MQKEFQKEGLNVTHAPLREVYCLLTFSDVDQMAKTLKNGSILSKNALLMLSHEIGWIWPFTKPDGYASQVSL